MPETVNPLRVGVVGPGFHGRTIVMPSLYTVDDIELVALATAHEETARRAERRYGARCHVGYQALVDDPEVEAVIVVGGPQGEVILAAVEAGKPVYSETPAVGSLEAAKALAARLERGVSTTVAVGFCRRYSPVYLQMKQILDEWLERDPTPRLAQVRYFPSVHHFYNLLLFLMGPVTEVYAVRGAHEAVVLMRFAAGHLGTLTWRSFATWSVPYEQLEIGTRSGLLVADDARTLRWHYDLEETGISAMTFESSRSLAYVPNNATPLGDLNQLRLKGYIAELEAFVRSVRTGEAPLSTIRDAVDTFLLGQAIAQAMECGEWTGVQTYDDIIG